VRLPLPIPAALRLQQWTAVAWEAFAALKRGCFLKKIHRLFSSQKAVDSKRCSRLTQSIAGLLKKKMAAYDLIAEISFRKTVR